jgi:hypothetical protein
MPEDSIAVIGIALCVQDVGMPHQVDKSVRDDRDVRACQMESQELPVLPFGEIDLCCVQASAFLRVQKLLLHAAEVEFGDRAWDGHFAFSKWGATATRRRTFRLIWNDRTKHDFSHGGLFEAWPVGGHLVALELGVWVV